MTWQKVATQYVIERIQASNYDADRAYIQALVQIEAYIQRGGPKSLAEGLVWRDLCQRYPQDVQQIQQELAPACAIDLTRFQQRKAAAKAQESRWQHRLVARRTVRQSAAERAWAKWGGRP